jgi:hypothetical protein
MISGEDEVFLRDYELSYEMSLLDFHRFICADLGYDPMSMSSFFHSNERWEQQQEFTPMDMGNDAEGGPMAMESVTLGQLLRHSRERLIYVFDPLADRALFLELTGTVRADPALRYPRVIRSEGVPPAQYSSGPDAAAESIFDDAMADFFDFEGDDLYDED